MTKSELKLKLEIVQRRYKRASILPSVMKMLIEDHVNNYLLSRRSWYNSINSKFGHSRMMDEIKKDKLFLVNLLENIFGSGTDIVRAIHKKPNAKRGRNRP